MILITDLGHCYPPRGRNHDSCSPNVIVSKVEIWVQCLAQDMKFLWI